MYSRVSKATLLSSLNLNEKRKWGSCQNADSVSVVGGRMPGDVDIAGLWITLSGLRLRTAFTQSSANNGDYTNSTRGK